MVAKSVLKTRQKHQMRENKSPISRQVATDGFSAPNSLLKWPIWRQVAKSGNPGLDESEVRNVYENEKRKKK